MAEDVPAMGSGEQIPCLALPVHENFALPVKLCLPQPTNFLNFSFSDLIPPPTGQGRGVCGDEGAAAWHLVASWDQTISIFSFISIGRTSSGARYDYYGVYSMVS